MPLQGDVQWGEAPFRRGRLHNIQVWPNAVICTDGPCIFLLMYTYEIYRLVAVYRPRHKPTLRLPGSSLSLEDYTISRRIGIK